VAVGATLSRELREGSLGGGVLVTATVLALALAWRDVDVSAIGNYELPYQVNDIPTHRKAVTLKSDRTLKGGVVQV
jgi:hypothetical protein